jgi:MoaA/NifB/PqqE/SkfB family radical SAM enzyme
VANLGYIQVVRHCNHFCGFCSNPTTPYEHSFESVSLLIDDFVERGYFGIILTGGEPTLHPELPKIAGYARGKGLHVRMITNGHRLADYAFAEALAEAGLQHVHVSVYSHREEVESDLRGTPNTLERAFAACRHANELGMDVNVNCVINRLNADHLDETIEYWLENHPYIRHFVWNNLDPSMGRAETNQARFTPRLADFEASLERACRLLHQSGRTFRVEKVPLCYQTAFAWASTETRKIVKGEERIVHFLDDKQTVRQTDWGHLYAECCKVCSLRTICGGLFDVGGHYDPAELYPVFVDRDAIVETIITDPMDPSYPLRDLDTWRADFERRMACVDEERPAEGDNDDSSHEDRYDMSGALPVGKVTEEGLRLFQKKRKVEGRRAEKLGVHLESDEVTRKGVIDAEKA